MKKQKGEVEVRRPRARVAYRAGRAMQAGGCTYRVGDLVPDASSGANLSECLTLGYLVRVEVDELTDDELQQLATQEEVEAAERIREENPGAVVAGTRAGGEEGAPSSPDVIVQAVSERIAELRDGEETRQRAAEHAERGRAEDDERPPPPGSRGADQGQDAAKEKATPETKGADAAQKTPEPSKGDGGHGNVSPRPSTGPSSSSSGKKGPG